MNTKVVAGTNNNMRWFLPSVGTVGWGQKAEVLLHKPVCFGLSQNRTGYRYEP